MPYARICEDPRRPIWTEVSEADLPAAVREQLAVEKAAKAKAVAPRPKPAVAKPKPVAPKSNGSGRRSPAKARPVIEGGVRISSRPTSTPSPDRVKARARADELLRRRGVPEAIIGSIPPPTGNPHRDAADDRLRRDGADEALIASVTR